MIDISWSDVTVLSSLQVAKVRPDGWNATELTSEEWPHNIWVQPGILNKVSIRTVPLSIDFYWTMFKCQIIEPQVPEPGGLVYTARDKDSFLARMDVIHKKISPNKQAFLAWMDAILCKINLTHLKSKPGSDGETSRQRRRCDPAQCLQIFVGGQNKPFWQMEKWWQSTKSGQFFWENLPSNPTIWRIYLQVQNLLPSFNFELHHLHVTRAWTRIYVEQGLCDKTNWQEKLTFWEEKLSLSIQSSLYL